MKKNIPLIMMLTFSSLSFAQSGDGSPAEKPVDPTKTVKENGRTYNFNFYNDGEAALPPSSTTVKVPEAAPVKEPVVTAPKAEVLETKYSDPEKSKRSGVAIVGGYFTKSYNQGDEEFPYEEVWDDQYRSAQLKSYTGLSVGLSFISQYDFSVEPKFMIGRMSVNNGGGSGRHFEGKMPGLRIDFKNKYWLSDHFGLFLGFGAYGYGGELKAKDSIYSYSPYAQSDDEKIRINGFGGDLNIGPTLQIGNLSLDGGIGYGIESNRISGHQDDVIMSNWNILLNLSLKI
ncbi:MAG: hypothetical protein HOE90_15470 [Bacteriovoracaceae bacterium]|jgi:hypothetical protein|nr:hypothetical protein [Bacteriovoracaceae bacterium]